MKEKAARRDKNQILGGALQSKGLLSILFVLQTILFFTIFASIVVQFLYGYQSITDTQDPAHAQIKIINTAFWSLAITIVSVFALERIFNLIFNPILFFKTGWNYIDSIIISISMILLSVFNDFHREQALQMAGLLMTLRFYNVYSTLAVKGAKLENYSVQDTILKRENDILRMENCLFREKANSIRTKSTRQYV